MLSSPLHQLNREILASVTLEPREPPKADPPTQGGGGNRDSVAQKTNDSSREATELVIRCMKKALAQSISSISMPEKERPLDPMSDFTFKTVTRFAPKSASPRGSGASCMCSGTVRPEDPFADSDDDSSDGSELEDTEDFTFTDHAPMCYRHIRAFFNVDPKSYQEVLCSSGWHSIPTPGKSTAQLFFCGQNWVIKTMTAEESRFLQTVLHRYYYHVRDNPHTLLPHFVGHHSIVLKSLNNEKIRFVIMQNVFATGNKIHEKFDLKGSTVNRFATREEKKKLTCTKKDLDINRPIRVGPKRRALLIEQIRKDCEFLKKASIMDYSFLLGIHIVDSTPVSKRINPLTALNSSPAESGKCFTADQGGMMSVDDVNQPCEIYYVGIIDILQEYNWWKASETVLMGTIYDRHQISSVPPKEYGNRFYSFVQNLIV
jgi:1-phosphatidylinositol-4-phosphate 5-kinase